MKEAFSGYRELPGLVGVSHMIVAFFGRLPIAMNVIGVLTLIVGTTHSVSIAAYCSAAFAVSNGIGNVAIGRLTDRFGQRTPLLAIAPVQVVSLLALVYLATTGKPPYVLIPVAALVGISTIPLGPMTRVRWYGKANSHQLPAAMSWETVNDEFVFVIGPAAVGILAATISPGAPLIMAAICVATCVVPFALSKNALGPAGGAGSTPSLFHTLAKVRTPIAVGTFQGMFFGSMQTTVTAYAESHGASGLGGLVYASMGFSAAITALLIVGLPAGFSFVKRIIWASIGLAIAAFACLLVGNLWALAVGLFCAGIFIGPIGVSLFTLAGLWAPPGGDGVANTAIVSSNVLGVALANSMIGRVLEVQPMVGFAVAGCFALCILAVALTWGRTDEQRPSRSRAR